MSRATPRAAVGRRRAPMVAPLLLAAALVLGGCASAPPAGSSAAPGAPGATGAAGTAPAPAMGRNPADPWEAFNRKVFAFNDAIDRAVLKPVAEGYRNHVPALVRTGIDNVIGNIGDVWSTANHFLQGKFASGLEMGMRVLTNTVFGLGGLLDPATEMRLVKRPEDLGQTLGRWGVGPGPYVVLPLFGPRTVRDTAGWLVDRRFDVTQLPNTDAGEYTVLAIDVVNTRANLLSASSLLDQVALDRYAFLRDAYLQRRLDAVYDGAPPMETYEDETDEARPKSEPTKP